MDAPLVQAEQFTLTPLSNPEEQIRLLRFVPDASNDEINLVIDTYDINRTPNYIAISYTWGDKEYTSIYIDGKPFTVRTNCRLALWQIRLHRPNEHLWIDSICIAQNEASEKGHQVRIMGRIYELASEIFACVGMHGSDSEAIFNSIEVRSEVVDDCEAEARCRAAIIPFISRKYFTRLWIVQELAAAAGRATICCGHDVISQASLNAIVDKHEASLRQQPSSKLVIERYKHVTSSRLRSLDLSAACVMTRDLVCTDNRDLVYGVLSLVEWDDDGQTVFPDYSSTPLQCLIAICPYIEPAALASIIPCFTDYVNDEGSLAALVANHRVSPHLRADDLPGEVTMDLALKAAHCAYVRSRSNGALEASIQAPTGLDAYKRAADDFGQQLIYSSHGTATGDTVEVAAALASSGIRPGDLLVRVKDDISYPKYAGFVLRHNSENVLDVVGVWVSHDEIQITEKGSGSEDPEETVSSDLGFVADLMLTMTAEDYIVLMARRINCDYRYGSYWHGFNPVTRIMQSQI